MTDNKLRNSSKMSNTIE